jgi:hypothetical protein
MASEPEPIMGLSRQAANALLTIPGASYAAEVLKRADHIRERERKGQPMIFERHITQAVDELEGDEADG